MLIDQICRQNLKTLTCRYIQKHSYTNVYMKWKKDSYLDSIESIHKSTELKPIIALKNRITASAEGCIPISDVSKKALQLDIPIKVARFLRSYPSVFEEFTGPQYNLPWFRLTPEAAMLDEEEQAVYKDCKPELEERLKRLILMSVEKKLPLKVIQGMLWYLGLRDDYLREFDENVHGCFKVVEMGDGLTGLSVVQTKKAEKILSVIQKNASSTRGQTESVSIPLFPSKGLRLRTKILDWMDGFQKLPYISPYEECPGLDPGSDLAEKRVVGLLHELLSLFVEHSAERKRLLCLRKYMGLPQKVHRVFERHPYVFYLSLRNKTCTAILKEAYYDKTGIKAHPLAEVRKKYIALVKKSKVILKHRRLRNGYFGTSEGTMELKVGEDDSHNARSEISLQRS